MNLKFTQFQSKYAQLRKANTHITSNSLKFGHNKAT